MKEKHDWNGGFPACLDCKETLWFRNKAVVRCPNCQRLHANEIRRLRYAKKTLKDARQRVIDKYKTPLGYHGGFIRIDQIEYFKVGAVEECKISGVQSEADRQTDNLILRACDILTNYQLHGSDENGEVARALHIFESYQRSRR